MKIWLLETYPKIDETVLKIKQKLVKKFVYLEIDLKHDGLTEDLCMWMVAIESAAFGLTVLTNIKSRRAQHVLITCTDNLKGFTEA